MAAALLIALAGCDTARTLEEGEINECGRCHGFAPGTTSTGAAHPIVAAPVEPAKCSPCHSGSIDASGNELPGHQNGTVEVTVAHAVPFDAHQAPALADLGSCKVCHGDDFAGGTSGESCTACHTTDARLAPGYADWATNCTFCHGTRSAGVTTATAAAAPPQAVVGTGDQTSANAKVGAHQAHLNAGTYAAALACDSCHTVPNAAAALTHFVGDGSQATITFSDTARKGVAGAAYAGAGGSCNVYCHGSGTELSGGQNTTPAWTSTGLACDACHGRPPASGPIFLDPNAHEFHTATVGIGCSSCHDGYTSSTVNPATHVNGAKEAIVGTTRINGWDCATCHDIVGVPAATHPVPYANHPSDALAGIGSCTSCHGTDYGDVSIAGATSCNTCHSAVAAGDWKTNCTFCHGARTPNYTSASLARAAPPDAVVDASDQTPANPKVGAHQAHVTAGSYSNGLACTSCHAVPDAAAALTHFTSGTTVATVTFDALAKQGAAGAAYTANGGGCTVYCHGNGTSWAAGALGTDRTPAWTQTTLACTACHASRPTTGSHTSVGAHSGAPCASCHLGYVQNTSVDPAIHVDGSKTVVFPRRGGGTRTLTNPGWGACDNCHSAGADGNANAPTF